MKMNTWLFLLPFLIVGCGPKIKSPPDQLTECVSIDGTDRFQYYIRDIKEVKRGLFYVTIAFVDTNGYMRVVTTESASNYKCKIIETGE